MLKRISYSVEHHQSSDHCGECYLNALFQAYFLGDSYPKITKKHHTVVLYTFHNSELEYLVTK